MVRSFDVKRLPASLKYAGRGIWHVLRTEQNARIHLMVTIAVLIAGLTLGIKPWEFAVLLLAIGFVLASEILNTVIEDFLDIIHPEHHPAVRQVKDALAGAVLIAAAVATLVGLLIFTPYVLAALGW